MFSFPWTNTEATMSEQSMMISGHAVVTLDGLGRLTHLQFLPDDEDAAVLEHSWQGRGWAQLMHNGAVELVADHNAVDNGLIENRLTDIINKV